ncbi:MAG: N-6 DNA methylase, partial [Methanosarcina sp.]
MVEITSGNISSFLVVLGFSLKDGEQNTYIKRYQQNGNYAITISLNTQNFNSSKIWYGDKIDTGRNTTTNFSQTENFVILECVDRLLEKGYQPENIRLEKDWKLGHREKGALDILVLDDYNKAFLMIECKTYGTEFEKEISNMNNDGGQLFSYYVQDKDTQYLCLYTSVFNGNEIFYLNDIVKITPSIRSSANHIEAYENWKPQVFETVGIFEKAAKPYLVMFSGIQISDLTPITAEDGGKIFNRFAEILRRNVISDKTNAYNKIFNLFLCKIVDEYERDEEELMKFQWSENESNVEVLLRLNELYKRGMEYYLGVNISSVDINEFTSKLKYLRSEKDKEELKNLFIRQKLYTSNDFAFKEVFDEETFNLNCIVVKEVVKLLEKFRIKYETKQHFLGDFFEQLLNTGIKQEGGQFFTPVPIAQFICKCLPIRKIIEDKNNRLEINILPYVIDYSSGAGHFITEIMEEIDVVTHKFDGRFFKNQKAKKEFDIYKNNFDWAKEYIYGIEKDYRLAKTTKVATYLNGDGDAQIFCADGLDNFYYSKEYKNQLKLSFPAKDLEKFDIVVANPPYSVDGFKTTINHGKESFDLYGQFTDKSNEIECLFIERTKQLLRIGGVAGIILPTNILEGRGIYPKVRKFIFENFLIHGIVRLGKETFFKTKTLSVILFLERVDNKLEDATFWIKKSISEKRDNAIFNIDAPISKYLDQTYKIDFETYIQFFSTDLDLDGVINNQKMYTDYSQVFKKKKEVLKNIQLAEIEKLSYFILCYNQELNVFCMPKDDINTERNLLGYEFSEAKGYEGIYIFNRGGGLYNPNVNADPSMINHYFFNSFHDNLLENTDLGIFKTRLTNIIDFQDVKQEYIISLNEYQIRKEKSNNNAKKAILKFREQKVIEKMTELIEEYKKQYNYFKKPIRELLLEYFPKTGTPFKRNKEYWEGGTINWLKIGDMNEKYITQPTEEKITEAGRKSKKMEIFPEGTVIFSIFATIGNVSILKIQTTLNQAICGLIPDTKQVSSEYLYYMLLFIRNEIKTGS